MPGDKRLDAIREHLAVWIERGQYVVSFWPESPSRWLFGKIVDPRTGACFTEPGAWDFIAEQLRDKGVEVKEIELTKPAGKKAYVLCVSTRQGVIYMKIEFGRDRVIGRSFHLSEKA